MGLAVRLGEVEDAEPLGRAAPRHACAAGIRNWQKRDVAEHHTNQNAPETFGKEPAPWLTAAGPSAASHECSSVTELFGALALTGAAAYYWNTDLAAHDPGMEDMKAEPQKTEPLFIVCGMLTDDTIWCSPSVETLITSLIPNYPAAAHPAAKAEARHNFIVSCATVAQEGLMQQATEDQVWKEETASPYEVDRLHANKSWRGDLGAPWSGVVPLIIVAPLNAARGSAARRALIGGNVLVVAGRSEADVLVSLRKLGMLTTAGRLDSPSQVVDPCL